MKKNGFTLAEVLITLAIIGVVATLTLPALITNTGEQQAISSFKKGINTLTEAAQMSSSIAGFDYSSLTVKSDIANDTDTTQSLYGLLSGRASIDKTKSTATNLKTTAGNSTSNYVVFFRDGAALSFPQAALTSKKDSYGAAAPSGQMQSDGLPYGIAALYDTNGVKGPNLLSNCDAEVAGVADESKFKTKATQADVDGQCTKANRVIRDQFGVRLRGGYAVPNGIAARWAFAN